MAEKNKADANLMPFEEALGRVLAGIEWTLPTEKVKVKDALDRVMRESAKAGVNIPPFNKSAMDGYAVKAADVAGASEKTPVRLEVMDEIPAGRRPEKTVKKGQAARIMTGAPLPKGADAVVMVEYTERGGPGEVLIKIEVDKGKNTGRVGEDVKKGEVVLESGSVIGPPQMGMLAALGMTEIKVSRRPKVAVISTGDEVTTPGKPLRPGSIYDANGYSLIGLAKGRGCDARFLGNVKDRPEALMKKLGQAEFADIVLMTGGVSVGDFDFVTGLLRSVGIRELFYKAFIQPGKPTFCGAKDKRLYFGLPGNPVSAMVCHELYVRPALDKMLGKTNWGMKRGKAVLDADLKVRPGRRKFIRASVAGRGPDVRVRPYKNQKSGILSSMIEADLLIDVPGATSFLESETVVDVWWL